MGKYTPFLNVLQYDEVHFVVINSNNSNRKISLLYNTCSLNVLYHNYDLIMLFLNHGDTAIDIAFTYCIINLLNELLRGNTLKSVISITNIGL